MMTCHFFLRKWGSISMAVVRVTKQNKQRARGVYGESSESGKSETPSSSDGKKSWLSQVSRRRVEPIIHSSKGSHFSMFSHLLPHDREVRERDASSRYSHTTHGFFIPHLSQNTRSFTTTRIGHWRKSSVSKRSVPSPETHIPLKKVHKYSISCPFPPTATGEERIDSASFRTQSQSERKAALDWLPLWLSIQKQPKSELVSRNFYFTILRIVRSVRGWKF